jgi:hypothetical protein
LKGSVACPPLRSERGIDLRPTIRPLGIGDLKVVKTKLARYEAGEIAHIENVLAREERHREHTRLHQTEEIVTVEAFREEENRRDLQSTERFEMEKETHAFIKSDTRFEAGLDLSASYGPVSLSVFANFTMSNTKEESDKEAEKYAKEVIDKSLRRVVERIREERQSRTLERVEETNKHGFHNTGRSSITGIYRWVDKYYRWRIVNYGKRLLYEFIVPEPGAYYTWAMQSAHSKVLPQKPAPPTIPLTDQPLTPASIDRTNYLALAQQHGAEGLNPPPPAFVIIEASVVREWPTPPDNGFAFDNEELEIPKGYYAGTFAFSWHLQTASNAQGPAGAVLFMGAQEFSDNLGGRGPFGPFLPPITGKLPINASGTDAGTLSLAVSVLCLLEQQHFEEWQLSTYRAVMAAFKKKEMDYEERLAAAQIQGGVAIEGDNPLLNRETEREQLQWLSLLIWARDPFQNPPGFDQLGTNAPSLNSVNATRNAEKIKFFQHAFEWRNMTYETYPYFWGRDSNRVDRMSLESSDPIFERFLRAGAARVVVPVRPSMTEAVLWYQLTGQIWSGGQVPSLTSTGQPEAVLYNTYVADMAGVQDLVDIDEDVVFDPAVDPLLKVPTNLVCLGDVRLPDLESP